MTKDLMVTMMWCEIVLMGMTRLWAMFFFSPFAERFNNVGRIARVLKSNLSKLLVDLNTVGHIQTAVGCTPTAVGHIPTAVGRTPTAVGHIPTAVGNPTATALATAVGRTPTAVGRTPTAVRRTPTAAGNPTAVGNPTSKDVHS